MLIDWGSVVVNVTPAMTNPSSNDAQQLQVKVVLLLCQKAREEVEKKALSFSCIFREDGSQPYR